jgi:hypothetical protein
LSLRRGDNLPDQRFDTFGGFARDSIRQDRRSLKQRIPVDVVCQIGRIFVFPL